MSEEQIRTLLQMADEVAGRPVLGPVSTNRIRRRIRHRRIITAVAPLAALVIILVGTSIRITRTRPGPPRPQERRIASLETQIEQLRAQTDATLRLVQEVLEKDRQERHLASLEAELAAIPDPRVEIERQVDKTAFILVYQADKRYKELNQTDSAVAAYKEVIQLFPTNRWAEVARERLAQIEKRQINKSDRKGEPTCEPGPV